MKPILTPHGFTHGAATVQCLCSDDKRGWVVIGIKTPTHYLDVYVTKRGKIRIHDQDKKEWKP